MEEGRAELGLRRLGLVAARRGRARCSSTHFDADGSGIVDFEEFLHALRDPLTPRRRALVALAFGKLDKDGSGVVEPAEVAGRTTRAATPT